MSNNKESVTEPCEMCGTPVFYGISLCVECDSEVVSFNELTGNYLMKSGEIIDTTKHQYEETLPNGVELCTYNPNGDEITDLIFAVNKDWLIKKIDISIDQYLDSYNFDDSEYLYRLASEQGQVLSVRYN